MRLPVIQGVIDRRILVNFRADPDVVSRILPHPFRPRLVHGVAMIGICLIRLKSIRPRLMPEWCGVASENAAHRIAVEWTQDGNVRSGVYVPCRDTTSRLNTLLGGWLFPGVHDLARFEVEESSEHLRVAFDRLDGGAHVSVEGTVAATLPVSSVFSSLREASDFFEGGSLGFSPARRGGTFEGLELKTREWRIVPLAMETVESSYFENRSQFPEGSVTLDCGLLMRRIRHEWHVRESLCGDCS